jgi:hypothetical protein
MAFLFPAHYVSNHGDGVPSIDAEDRGILVGETATAFFTDASQREE